MFRLAAVALIGASSPAFASVVADLSNRTVTGVNDGSSLVEITNGTDVRKTFNTAAKIPPGTKDLKPGQKKVAPMSDAGFKYYFEKFVELKTKNSTNNFSAASKKIADEVKKTCMDARDFVGCVKALGTSNDVSESDDLASLRRSMKKVSARLVSGTSLRDSSEVFQPVIDDLALVEDEYPDILSVKAAAKASRLFDILQSAWQGRIDTLSVHKYAGTRYSCMPTQNGIDRMNAVIGSQAISPGSSMQDSTLAIMFAGGACHEGTVEYHEGMMMSFIAGVLKEGSVSPVKIKQYESERSEILRLSAMEAWDKHLEKNPSLKIWANANPSMAAKERKKYNSENQTSLPFIPEYAATLNYLSKFNPPL